MIATAVASTPPSTAAADTGPIAYLSSPTDYQMANDWFDVASAEHFWFQWRLWAITRLLGGSGLVSPVFEVGCGAGVARLQFAQYFDVDVDGCDINDPALQQAKPGRGRLYYYNIHDRRPEFAERYGTILLLDALEHIDDPVAFLQSIRYHLRVGGRLLVNVPAQQWLYGRYDEVDGHVKRYDKRTLRREAAAADLHVERTAYWGGTMIPVVLARKLMLAATPRERVMARGFAPASPAVDFVLRSVMRLEQALCPAPLLGASLAAVLRRESV